MQWRVHTGQTVPDWPQDDYDTIWTVRPDAQGNLTVDNSIISRVDVFHQTRNCHSDRSRAERGEVEEPFVFVVPQFGRVPQVPRRAVRR